MHILSRIAAILVLAMSGRSVSANPIVVDPAEMEVVKRSELLEIVTGPEFSTISITLRYVEAPSLVSEKSEWELKYFQLQIPVFTRASVQGDGNDLLRFHEVEVSSGGTGYQVEFLGEITRKELLESMKRMTTSERQGLSKLYAAPKGTKLVFFVARLPVALAKNSSTIVVRYRQEHVLKGSRKYAFYVPVFEHPALWSALAKRSSDFQATIRGAEGVVPVVEDSDDTFPAYRDDSGEIHYFLRTEQTFWIRIETAKSGSRK